MKTCKLCWGVSALLIAVIAGMAYMFVIKGSTSVADDGRTAIFLSEGERDLVLAEMRGFLEGVQEITAALAENDMKEVASSAHALGMASAGAAPASLMAKLPLEFMTMGMGTHEAFDALAIEAEDLGDQKVILTKLSDLMNNCTTCHAGYRFEVEGQKGK
ncbi:MAG: hypothetical protein JKY82_08345 [Rhizobiaceae bacterium]|nr:hypothetical protein [Rhizobiaceae bacterium]